MQVSIEEVFVIAALLLIASIVASKVAVRTGIPALLLFVFLGILMGVEGVGGILLDDAYLVQSVGVAALVFILFSGGLSTEWESIRPVIREGVLLSTVGVIVTALSVGWFMNTFFGFSWEGGILLGAIMASTDAAAVFSVLRGSDVHLKGRLSQTLELESGSNDPMAVFLSFGMIGLMTGTTDSALELVPMFFIQMGVGAGLGYALGRLTLVALNRIRLEYDGLYPVLSVSLVMLTYGATTTLGGNGFLAVYIAGVTLGRETFIHKESLNNFHDGLAWLMQIAMFLTLGLKILPSNLIDVAGTGIVVALFLIFIARPLSVFIAAIPTNMTVRERVFISWVGLRGAAPIILATFPLLAGIETPVPIFELVFFVVLTSVLLQGTLIIPAAKWLKLYDADYKDRPSLLAQMMQQTSLNRCMLEITVPYDSTTVGKRIIDLDLPHASLVMLISRADEVIAPRGGTVLEADDRLLIVAGPKSHLAIHQSVTGDSSVLPDSA